LPKTKQGTAKKKRKKKERKNEMTSAFNVSVAVHPKRTKIKG
jgi:hypothetical protein